MYKGGPPYTEEAFCVTEEARRVQRRPAVYRRGLLCHRKEARRVPTEEARRVQRRPAVCLQRGCAQRSSALHTVYRGGLL